jgi:hypothetical protein
LLLALEVVAGLVKEHHPLAIVLWGAVEVEAHSQPLLLTSSPEQPMA